MPALLGLVDNNSCSDKFHDVFDSSVSLFDGFVIPSDYLHGTQTGRHSYAIQEAVLFCSFRSCYKNGGHRGRISYRSEVFTDYCMYTYLNSCDRW